MYFISNHDRHQLSYSGKKKVSVKCLFILSSATGYTETVLDVINSFFHIYADFVCTIHFMVGMPLRKWDLLPSCFIGRESS